MDNKKEMSPAIPQKTQSTIPKPYSLIFHPFLTILEKIVSKVVDSLGFKALAELEIGSKASNDALSKIRNMMSKSEIEYGGSKKALKKWSMVASSKSSSPCILAESSGCIPFRKKILQEWNIVDDDAVLPDAMTNNYDREGVKILVRFPSSLLSAELREQGTILEYSGCLEVDFDKVDWRKFAPNIPMLVHFHGGGMTVGQMQDSLLIEDTVRLVQNAPTALPPDVITVSVDYGLAPEDPFPLGIMDALSVIDYILKDNSSRKSVHLTGTSAGANVSLVAGLEGFRRFPGRISSIQAQSPLINPAGDSMSYYTNQNVFPSVGWLRWSWQVYLGLGKPNVIPNENDHESESDSRNTWKDTLSYYTIQNIYSGIEYVRWFLLSYQRPEKEKQIQNGDDNESELERVLRQGSNYSSWNVWKAKYPSTALHRLVNPALGIPEGLNDDKAVNTPKIIVRYNIGDPLHDDGKVIAGALKEKAGGNATFYEERGLHCNTAGSYDENAPQEYWKVWSEAVFGDDNAK
jgi:acetyl esterase/lipase